MLLRIGFAACVLLGIKIFGWCGVFWVGLLRFRFVSFFASCAFWSLSVL